MSGSPRSVLAQFPFGAGMDESADPRLLEPPALLSAENVRWTQSGALAKRYGNTVAISGLDHPYNPVSAITDGGPARMYALRDCLVGIDGLNLWEYSPTANPNGKGVYKDEVPAPLVTTTVVSGSETSAVMDVAYGTTASAQKYRAYALGARVVVVDHVTGAVIPTRGNAAATRIGGLFTTTVVQPRLVVVGNYLCMVHGAGGNAVSMYVLDTSTWTWGSVVAVLTNCAAAVGGVLAPRFEVAAYNSTTYVIAYCTTGNALVARRIDLTGATVATFTSAESAANPVRGIGLEGSSSDNFYHITYFTINGGSERGRITRFSWNTGEAAGFPATVYTPVAAAAVPYSTSVCRYDATNVAAVYTCEDTNTIAHWRTDAAIVTTAGVVGQSHRAYHALMASKPRLMPDGRVLFAVYSAPQGAGDAGSSMMMADARIGQTGGAWPIQPVALIEPRSSLSTAPVPSVVTDADGVVYHTGVTSYVTVDDSASSNDVLGALDVSLDFGSYARWLGSRQGDALYFNGFAYDGMRCAEHTFHRRPYCASLSNLGAGNVDIGVHYYVTTYSWTTQGGALVESGPSNVQSITIGGASASVRVRTSSYGLTALMDEYQDQNAAQEIYINIYRTAAGTSGPYYLVGRVANSLTAEVVDYTDNSSDATIATAPQLYTGLNGTQQAEMSNVSPPAFIYTTTHRDRLFGLAPDRRTVWFTDKFVRYVHPRWHDELTLYVDDQDGLVALASLETTLLAFSPRRIYVLDGDGPSFRFPGADSDYQGFRLISSDTGCSQPQSICATQFGVFFRSDKGLYLVDRGGTVTEIGGPVQNQLEQFETSVATWLHPVDKVVCFDVLELDAGSLSAGRRLVYDYRAKAWSIDKLTGTDADQPIRASVPVGSVVYWLGSDEKVYAEDRTTYLDGSTWVTMRAKLAPFKSAGPQGHQGTQAFVLLGERHTAHKLTIRADYDYGTTRTDSVTWASTDVEAFGNSPVMQVRRMLKVKENESVTITLTDEVPTANTGTGQGSTWVAFAFDHEPKKQPFPLPPAQQR